MKRERSTSACEGDIWISAEGEGGGKEPGLWFFSTL